MLNKKRFCGSTMTRALAVIMVGLIFSICAAVAFAVPSAPERNQTAFVSGAARVSPLTMKAPDEPEGGVSGDVRAPDGPASPSK